MLLGPQGGGKSRFLLSLLDGSPSMLPAPVHGSNPSGNGRVGFCGSQELVHPHLSVRENLRLFAALNGMPGSPDMDEIIARTGLAEYINGIRADGLPKQALRTLQWAIALLPDPDILLIDDLADGLSLLARRQLWELIASEQTRRPRLIFYATRDLEAVRFLAEEVWWIENGCLAAKLDLSSLPPVFHSAAALAFDFYSPSAAGQFLEKAGRASFVLACRRLSPSSIEVLVSEQYELVTLIWTAGFDLASFRTLSLKVDETFSRTINLAVGSSLLVGDSPASPSINGVGLARLSARQRWVAIGEVARSTWREHFRTFWKAGNLLFSAIFLLSLIQLVISVEPVSAQFLSSAPLVLMLASGLVFGLGLESLSRWTALGETGNLFRSARSRGPGRSFSFLAQVDLTPLRRLDLLAGLTLGHLAVLGAHSWPVLFFLYAAWEIFASAWLYPAVFFLFWLLTALDALALVVIISGRVTRPRWGLGLGWLLWFVIPVVSWLGRQAPFVWVWPFAGFSHAFTLFPDLGQAWLPLACTGLGSGILWLGAVRSFRLRPSLWSPKK